MIQQRNPDCNEVYHWSEFIDFATRLGIDLSQPIVALTIVMRMENPVVITQEFLAIDVDERESSNVSSN